MRVFLGFLNGYRTVSGVIGRDPRVEGGCELFQGPKHGWVWFRSVGIGIGSIWFGSVRFGSVRFGSFFLVFGMCCLGGCWRCWNLRILTREVLTTV